jgi:GNAT superfamily N-acetyltransferase
MSLDVRMAVPADAAAIHGFIRALAAYERDPDAVMATPESLRAQMQEPRPPFECLLAETAGRAVGFALYFFNYSSWRGRPGIYLEDLFVLPEERGRGAGKALLARLARIAVERGCARLEWIVVNWNQPAIDFYRALGARSLDDWTVFRLDGEGLERLAGR